jgi:hypothetical protein
VTAYINGPYPERDTVGPLREVVPLFDTPVYASVSDPFLDAPEWAIALHRENQEILDVHRKVLAVVEEIKPEVMSVVNSLQKNPMFRMFLGGK